MYTDSFRKTSPLSPQKQQGKSKRHGGLYAVNVCYSNRRSTAISYCFRPKLMMWLFAINRGFCVHEMASVGSPMDDASNDLDVIF